MASRFGRSVPVDGEQNRSYSNQKVDTLRKELGVNDSDPTHAPTPTLSQEQVRNYNAMRLEADAYMKLRKKGPNFRY